MRAVALRMSLAVSVLVLAWAPALQADPDPRVDPEGWRRVPLGEVGSLALPRELEETGERGADSLYRRFVGAGLAVSVDYGWYANSLSDVSGASVVRTPTELDGRRAVQVVWEDRESADAPFRAGVHVPAAGPHGARFTLSAEAASAEQRDQALRVARSVRFVHPPPTEPRK